MDRKEKIEKLLKSTTATIMYNGWNNRTDFGYHSYDIDEIKIKGQRNPSKRIHEMKKFIKFNNKIVLDFGCNVGSMLHHLPEIKKGIGFDYDPKCINVANKISSILNLDNLLFYTHDFDLDKIDKVNEKIKESPDIIFLLSLGSWIKKWEELYDFCLNLGGEIILETNNDQEGGKQLAFFKSRGKQLELIIDNSFDDSTGNNKRKTYLIY